MLVFNTSCQGQSKTDLSKENIKSETKDIVTSSGPNRITRNIIQDRKGNIWIASWEGIFKYDGKSFTNITSKVSSARFFSVLEDSKGNLWFGSIGSGVYYYDGKSFRNFTTKEGLAGNGVTCIYEDKTGNIWFGTEAGASRYDGKSFRNFKIREVLPPTDADSVHVSVYQHQLPEGSWMHNDVNSIIEDKTGKLWFGTRGYACVYDGKTFTTITNKDGKPFANVRSIIEDKKGNIWLGGYDGLWRYNGSTFTNFSQKFVGYIYEDKKGNIWTSSERDNSQAWVSSERDNSQAWTSSERDTWALSRYDGKSLSNKKPTVTKITYKPMIFGILEDDKGSIWFGAVDGVYRYDGKTITDFKSKEGQK
ncbi:MAG TPA: two-component regulator propeller domain-containing protein [Mucilaginibacter sp.]|nr:two-component regulator propeller domain-containing protein [Mucilaginibacter sp.]